MGLVKPMIQTSVHYCEATRKGKVVHYEDNTNLAEMGDEGRQGPMGGMGGGQNMPVTDAEGNALTTEFGYCLYKDSQMVTI